MERSTFAKATVDKTGCGAVGSASGLGPEGRQFESGHPDKIKSLQVRLVVADFYF